MADILPCATCGGKCCHAAPFNSTELRLARLANGGRYPPGARLVSGIPIKAIHGGGMGHMVVTDLDTLRCAFYKDGKCSIYETRPLACRLYGEIPAMPCQELYPEAAAIEAERLWSNLIKAKMGIISINQLTRFLFREDEHDTARTRPEIRRSKP